MKQLALALIVLVSGSALAQEIGTEISPSTPPTPPPEQKGGFVYKPKDAPPEEKGASGNTTSPSASGSSATFTGTKASGGTGDFGIRAGFGSSGSIGLPTGSGSAASVTAPTVGIAYFLADNFKLLADVGFGLALVGSSALLALSATVGFDYLFRTPSDVMRPFFHFGASFNMAGSSNFAVGASAQVGFGAEYFFNPAFSVNGRLLLGVPMGLSPNFVLGIFTVTPGVGATWYL